MTRVHTLNSPISIEINQKPSQFYYRFPILVITLAVIIVIAYFLATPAEHISAEKHYQYEAKNIPKIYSKLETVDPDEREVFQGFRTSFLPSEEIILARRGKDSKGKKSKEIYEGNVTSDILIWDSSEDDDTPTRVKRMSHFTFTSHNYDANEDEPSQSNSKETIYDEYDDSESDEEDDEESGSTEYQEDEDLKRAMRPELHVDRGPLDDVVEQIRGQPELEEGEIGSSSYLYKPGNSYTGIHAFWKGQGDRETIRNTQAKIMKKYMDQEADPCHDFYQYACGNWAHLNPIPADKAGYDTFEMLRENLDAVLKELLEFKSHEIVPSQYPGENLALDDNFLDRMKADLEPENKFVTDTPVIKMYVMLNNTDDDESQPESSHAEIINRIRRYLNKKSRALARPVQRLKAKLHKYFHKRNKHHEHEDLKQHYYRSNRYDIRKMQSDTRVVVKRSIKRNTQIFGRKPLSVVRNNVMKRKTHDKEPEDFITTVVKPNPILVKPKTFQIPYDSSNKDAQLKARYLFKSCMNYEILSKRGHQPLLDLLNLLGGWPILDTQWTDENFDWLSLVAKLRLYNNDILLSEWVGPDIKNSDEFVIQFDQTSLGLPTRDYFLQDSNKVYLNAYKNYLIKIAMLLGGEPKHVKKSVNELIDFEIKLAKITSAPEDRRNVSELYRRMTLQKLEKLVPEVKWRRYLCMVMNRTVDPHETVVLFALTYVRHLVKLIDQTNPSILANYLLWRFVRHRVNNLDDRFQSAKQQFYFILLGREQAPPRWKNCISQVNSNMGMALGSMFVKKYFDETSKNDTLRMTREIQQSFRELLHTTEWIDDTTKKLAAHKVDAMMLRIGYPDFILNQQELDDRYKEVIISPDKYFENILNILQHLTKTEQSRLGQPVNKKLWNTAPAVVNAYYSRNKNQIMFPAGILQPPFYHRHFPRSLNYGGIGVVIGHEITHGFDDKGRLFDCDGNLHRWWSDSAISSFHYRAQCLIDQYGQYVVPEVNVRLNGINTQGENIADNGGVKQAFRAYLHWLRDHGVEGETLPGLNHTHTQLFFLNFAQVWCGAMRPEAMRNKLKTAVHSPGRFRVIGTLSNSLDFAREFQCPVGSPMNPKHKCNVW